MSFADPQSVTIATVATPLPRTRTMDNGSRYRKSDGTVTLSVLHQEGKRNRRTVRIDFEKVAADPYDNDRNRNYSGSVYVVMDSPIVGFTNQEIADHLAALTGWLTPTNTLKVLGGES